LADAIRKVLANVGLRAEMRAKGLLQAQKFSWKRNAEQTMEIYRKVVYD
jgi:glycosyltransferase involved in cell wall biosynthesis